MKVSLKTFMPITAASMFALASCSNVDNRAKEYMSETNRTQTEYNNFSKSSMYTKQSKLDSMAYRDIFNSTQAAKDSAKTADFNKIAACMRPNEEENKDLLSVVKKRGELVVGVKFDSKPFGFVENGKLQGYDIDIAHLLAKRIFGNEKLVRFLEVNASNRISKLNSGEVDMLIATMTINPKRMEVVDFSVPYFYTGQAIMIRKGTDIKTVGDLNGRRVIVVLGTTGEKNIRYYDI